MGGSSSFVIGLIGFGSWWCNESNSVYRKWSINISQAIANTRDFAMISFSNHPFRRGKTFEPYKHALKTHLARLRGTWREKPCQTSSWLQQLEKKNYATILSAISDHWHSNDLTTQLQTKYHNKQDRLSSTSHAKHFGVQRYQVPNPCTSVCFNLALAIASLGVTKHNSNYNSIANVHLSFSNSTCQTEPSNNCPQPCPFLASRHPWGAPPHLSLDSLALVPGDAMSQIQYTANEVSTFHKRSRIPEILPWLVFQSSIQEGQKFWAIQACHWKHIWHVSEVHEGKSRARLHLDSSNWK